MYLFIVATLLPAIEENTSRMVLFDLVESCRAHGMPALVKQVKKETRNQLHFNSQHPDGHYDLTLANKVDRAVAQHCIIISNWAKNRSLARGWPDLSEHGNHECLRHCFHQRHSFSFCSDEWQLPEEGRFEFDFVSHRIRHELASVVDESTLNALKNSIIKSNCNFRSMIVVVRLVAHLVVLQPEQMKEIILLFPFWDTSRSTDHVNGGYDFRPRADVYVTLYNRTLYNAQVVSPYLLYNKNVFHQQEMQEIQERLGHMHTFDIMNCHETISNLGNSFGPLDMHTYEGWLVTKLLLHISLPEPSTNFYYTQWSQRGSALSKQGYVFVIPSAWVPDPPRSGVFTTTFRSEQEEVLYLKRRDLATTYLDWSFPPEQIFTRRALLRRHDSDVGRVSLFPRPPSPLSPSPRRRASTDVLSPSASGARRASADLLSPSAAERRRASTDQM